MGPDADDTTQGPAADGGDADIKRVTDSCDADTDEAVGTDATGFVWNTGSSEPAPGPADETPPTADVKPTDDGAGPGDAEAEDVGAGSSELSPDRYLLAGERVVERVDLGPAWVAATTHRLLVFDPDADPGTRRFEAIDRPNVVGVRVSDEGNPAVLGYASKALLFALILLGGGLVAGSVGLGSLFSTASGTGAGTTPGIGGLTSMLSLAGALLGLFVDALRVGGVVAGGAALALGVWYLRGRRPTLVVERAGDDDVTVTLPSRPVGDRVVETLERALADELAVGRDA
jgi:hypothetical protein